MPNGTAMTTAISADEHRADEQAEHADAGRVHVGAPLGAGEERPGRSLERLPAPEQEEQADEGEEHEHDEPDAMVTRLNQRSAWPGSSCSSRGVHVETGLSRTVEPGSDKLLLLPTKVGRNHGTGPGIGQPASPIRAETQVRAQ